MMPKTGEGLKDKQVALAAGVVPVAASLAGAYAPAAVGGVSATFLGAAALTAAVWPNPGPWRWVPGYGQPYGWLCRREMSLARRRARRRLCATRAIRQAQQWHRRKKVTGKVRLDKRPEPTRKHVARVRTVAAARNRARCKRLTAAWEKLPGASGAWWRIPEPTTRHLVTGWLLTSGLWSLALASGVSYDWRALAGVTALSGVLALVVKRRGWRSVETPTSPWAEVWAERIGRDGGALPGSYLVDLDDDDEAVRATVVSEGRPADTVPVDAISVAYDVPASRIVLYRPKTASARRASVKIYHHDKVEDSYESLSWAEKWAAQMTRFHPGSEVVGEQDTEHGRDATVVLTPGDPPGTVKREAVSSGLLIPEDQLHLTPVGPNRLRVTQLSSHPLQGGVPLLLDDLRMGDDGFVVVGRDIYGRPMRYRLLKPMNGAAHSFMVATTGGGKTQAVEVLLLAERQNNVFSIVADMKEGGSLPTWRKTAGWFVRSHSGLMAAAEGVRRASDVRNSVNARHVWADEDGDPMEGLNFFDPGVSPFPALSLTADEFNAFCGKGAKHVVAATSSDLDVVGRQGRSTGCLLRVTAQTANMDTLGPQGGEIRRMCQSGNTILLRTADSDSDAMALGSERNGQRLPMIPKTFPGTDIETGGVCYTATGEGTFIQGRFSFDRRAAKWAGQMPEVRLDGDTEEALGPVFWRRHEYIDATAQEEEHIIQEILEEEASKKGPRRTVIDVAPRPEVAQEEPESDIDDDVDGILKSPGLLARERIAAELSETPVSRSHIAGKTGFSPTHVSKELSGLKEIGRAENPKRGMWKQAA